MKAVRIVCTFDAAGVADALMRVLAAEQNDVRISKGRLSLQDLPAARDAQEAVILIWSLGAPGSEYIQDWADAIPPARLVEIARTPSWPESKRRRAPVIDFTRWRGERAGKAWDQLKGRLRQVWNLWEPEETPPLRAYASGALSIAAAMTGVVLISLDDNAPQVVKAEPTYDESARLFGPLLESDGDLGMGGVVEVIEPASVEDLTLAAPRLRLRASEFDTVSDFETALLEYSENDLRDPTLFERFAALNPLGRRD